MKEKFKLYDKMVKWGWDENSTEVWKDEDKILLNFEIFEQQGVSYIIFYCIE